MFCVDVGVVCERFLYFVFFVLGVCFCVLGFWVFGILGFWGFGVFGDLHVTENKKWLLLEFQKGKRISAV